MLHRMLLLNRALLTQVAARQRQLLTAVSMWADTVARRTWTNRGEVLEDYPSAGFVTGGMAVFSLGPCIVTAQIAFNSGVVIVLAATAAGEAE